MYPKSKHPIISIEKSKYRHIMEINAYSGKKTAHVRERKEKENKGKFQKNRVKNEHFNKNN